MKICIPTLSKDGALAAVCDHFGSAPVFTIYDSETKTYDAVENSNAHHSHGACHPIAALSGRAIDVVVCRGMGRRAIEKFNSANIRVVRGDAAVAQDTVDAFLAGKLEELSVDGACSGHGCH